jgi:hypothetical protein
MTDLAATKILIQVIEARFHWRVSRNSRCNYRLEVGIPALAHKVDSTDDCGQRLKANEVAGFARHINCGHAVFGRNKVSTVLPPASMQKCAPVRVPLHKAVVQTYASERQRVGYVPRLNLTGRNLVLILDHMCSSGTLSHPPVPRGTLLGRRIFD